jgi:hypothetical protein
MDVVSPACNPRILEVEVGGSQVRGQPGLHSEILSQNTKEIPRKEVCTWSGEPLPS